MIAAAVVVLVQIGAVRSGRPSPFGAAASTLVLPAQATLTVVTTSLRGGLGALGALPGLASENARLSDENRRLTAENGRLREAAAIAPEDAALALAMKDDPADIPANVVGYAPESDSRTITIDRGAQAGVAVDDGVISPEGIVGRVVETDPLASKVLLAIDVGSQIPAVVQRGRWWGIATGTNSRLQLRFVSQDAKLKVGDAVVTGDGHAFHAGLPIGRIARIARADAALYQTAVLEPAVVFGRLHRVLVVPH